MSDGVAKDLMIFSNTTGHFGPFKLKVKRGHPLPQPCQPHCMCSKAPRGQYEQRTFPPSQNVLWDSTGLLTLSPF